MRTLPPEVRISEALEQARGALEAAEVGAAKLTAELLLAQVLGCERSFLYGHPDANLSPEQHRSFEKAFRDRALGKPTQYITGVQEFYGREFRVTPEVMIPRPETEHLVEAALSTASGSRLIVDAGSGSGAIAVTLALETRAAIVATDISAAALRVTAENALRLGARVSVVQCDLLAALAGGLFDLVVSNPPYVPDGDRDGLQREVRDWEPPGALFGGPAGLDFYQRLAGESPRVLRPGGRLIVELGIRQLEPVRAMLDEGWNDSRVVDDLAGLPRVLSVRYAP